MSYSNPMTLTYSFGEIDTASATETLTIKGPSGKKGYVVDVVVSSTELFDATTTEAFVKLGSAENGGQYVSMGMGTLADKAVQLASDTAADIVLRDLPADTAVWLSTVASTGGTPAGKCYIQVIISWY